jgi:hypothetical protein
MWDSNEKRSMASLENPSSAASFSAVSPIEYPTLIW